MSALWERPASLGTRHILGVRVDDITLDETLAAIAAMLAAGGAHQLVTLNPEFVMQAQHNQPFRATLEAATLAVPDGAGIMLAARWQHRPLRTRVTGVDLTLRLAQASAEHGWRLFLLGAAPGVAEQAAEALRRHAPGCQIVGCWSGSPAEADQPAIATQLATARPQIVLVAYGAPAQDLWIRRYGPALGLPLGIGVGGTFDYLAGVQPRAPRIIRRFGLEWMHRLMTQPRRWRRIWTAVVRFGWAAWREARRDYGNR